uniref:Uncharacterized protein n=1 Tax=viral metagenome TaxID=1070528 RepID=A0A6M3JIG5_9ZZZZ
MDYLQMFKSLSDAGTLFIGSAAIIGFGALIFGCLIWLYIWLGKHLIRYVRKVAMEFRESLSPEVSNGRRVRT